jgi:hypothetical protein
MNAVRKDGNPNSNKCIYPQYQNHRVNGKDGSRVLISLDLIMYIFRGSGMV